MHFCKMINTFHKDLSKKQAIILPSIDSALPIAKPMTKLLIRVSKRKQDQPIKSSVN